MSNKRKARPRKPTGYTGGIPHSSVTPGQASDLEQAVKSAPVLELPVIRLDGTGTILTVDKLGFLGDPSWILSGEGNAYLQTTDGDYYRLPASLNRWARDVVTDVLAMGGRKSGVFPTRIEFGIVNGRPYAEMLAG